MSSKELSKYDTTGLSVEERNELLEQVRDMLGKQVDLGGSPLRWFPVVKLSRDSAKFNMVRGGEELENSPKNLRVIFLGLGFESRTLFTPKEDGATKSKLACYTRVIERSKDSYLRLEGRWISKDIPEPEVFEITPDDEKVCKCQACPWSKRGTQKQWEPGKDGEAAACKKSMYMFFVMAKFENNEWTVDDKEDPEVWMIRLSMTSRQAVDQIAVKALTLRSVVQGCVYELSVKREGQGNMEYSTLSVDKVVGSIKDVNLFRTLLSNGNRIASSFNSYGVEEVQAVAEAVVSEEELTF